jgi:hypothetical protein
MINNIDDCLETLNKQHFFIQDDVKNQPAFIKELDGQFEVYNPTQKEINFLKIDDCLEFDKNSQKCDCAVFDDDTFCFIELKTMTSDKTSTKNKRRKIAQNQLKYTIKNFKDNEIVKNKTLEAYVSITCMQDDRLVKIPNIQNQDTILEFEEEYKTALFYECKKEFLNN